MRSLSVSADLDNSTLGIPERLQALLHPVDGPRPDVEIFCEESELADIFIRITDRASQKPDIESRIFLVRGQDGTILPFTG